ncbi:hypothetical protein AB0B66_38395 [Catellatospora sp. NPDC049111]
MGAENVKTLLRAAVGGRTTRASVCRLPAQGDLAAVGRNPATA